ncbi:alpha/beta fold hydrolase [Nocardia sp. CS682]|uniref:alpha/beta fold hydrolase n=1 Tax=Nocardia sp. CS682 TaxID=1047172 RepID=UPI001074F5C3|nr:alpha/beta hydrolase [Nocardia sp. CS682]QBS45063.1 alpha/beta hydrolase [Nocardia sp. CS682]
MRKPTIVLVHGAFADATSSWNSVAANLIRRGHTVLAPANPLRGLRHDADYLRSVLEAVAGPIVLVGHSYGGAVITQAATGADSVTGLVYIAAFAPDEGESAAALDEKFGGAAQHITQARPLPGPDPQGPPNIELTIDPAHFHTAFAPDADPDTAAVLTVTQRPLALAAMLEPAGAPAWKTLPSHYALATRDQMIPLAGQRLMAARMNATTIEVPTGHAAMLGAPEALSGLIAGAAE